jgi:hypothetical protein
MGGLNLFNLDDFLTSQQCKWVLLANNSLRDNWRVNLFNLSYGNCLGTGGGLFDKALHPILHGIGVSFEKLRICHDSADENYLKATVLNNPMIFRGPGNKLRLDPDYLETANSPEITTRLAKLAVEECYGRNGFLTRQEFRISLGLDLSVTGYANLGRAVNHFINQLSVNQLNDGTSCHIADCFRLKKPGKKIRMALVKRRKKPFNLETLTTCQTFFRITELNYIGNDLFGQVVELWIRSGFTNRMKTFIFKFFNNWKWVCIRKPYIFSFFKLSISQ